MQRYQDYVLASVGGAATPLSGATVNIYAAGTTNLSTIFSTDAGAAKTNPTTTDSAGRFFFYAADGKYDILITKTGYASQSQADVILEDPIDGIGYSVGTGGAVTQLTSKSTAVVLNKTNGAITLHVASLGASTTVGFTLTNSAIAATDVVVTSIKSGGTVNAYVVYVDTVAAGSCRISIRNNTGGALSEAVVINFALIKAVVT